MHLMTGALPQTRRSPRPLWPPSVIKLLWLCGLLGILLCLLSGTDLAGSLSQPFQKEGSQTRNCVNIALSHTQRRHRSSWPGRCAVLFGQSKGVHFDSFKYLLDQSDQPSWCVPVQAVGPKLDKAGVTPVTVLVKLAITSAAVTRQLCRLAFCTARSQATFACLILNKKLLG